LEFSRFLLDKQLILNTQSASTSKIGVANELNNATNGGIYAFIDRRKDSRPIATVAAQELT